VRLTGVCSIQGGQDSSATAFWIHLRRPDDVAVLEQPPWWTARHTAATAVVAAVVLVAVAGWVVMLRRRVRAQTEAIRREVERQTASEARYRELFENAKDIVYSHDLGGYFISINPAGERILGYAKEEIIKLKLHPVAAPEHQEEAHQLMQRHVALAAERPSN